MTITLDKTVWEIVRELPSSVPVFEALGIDYHGRRRKTLKQACAELNLSGAQVLEELETAGAETLQELEKPGAEAHSAGF